MDNDSASTSVDRRRFFRGAALIGAVGATFLGTSVQNEASGKHSGSPSSCRAARHAQSDQEEFELFCRSFFEAFDSLQLEAFMSHFADAAFQQDVVLGDLSDFGAPPPVNCSTQSKAVLTQLFAGLFEVFRQAGGVSKFIHAYGSMKYGGAADVKCIPGTLFRGGFDLISYLDVRNGKIFRRNDCWDSAQLTPEDIAFIHPGGVPRVSCVAGPQPGDIANASPEMFAFTRAFTAALASGHVGRVLQFFSDDALLIHSLLYSGSGPIGPFNRGLRIRGRASIARFFRALLPVLPDGEGVRLVHVLGGRTGGAFEWRSEGLYSQQGIGRTGICGITAIELFGDRIQRMSVKLDTLQMTPEQRATVQRALARECLVAA